MGFVLLYFGINELFDPSYWGGYVPPIVLQFFPFSVNVFVQSHGLVLSLLGLCLFFKIQMRVVGFLTMIVLLSIIGGLIMTQGFTEIVARDIGLFGLALALWLHDIQHVEPL